MEFHGIVLKVGISLNILSDADKGMCRGYTMKWIEAYLTSRQSAYRLSIAAIKNLAEDIPKTEKIDHLIEQLADGKREAASLSDEELDLF